MKRIFTILSIATAVLFASDMYAQDGGKKDKKKKKNAVDSTQVDKRESPAPGGSNSGSEGPSEITIDEPGTGRTKTTTAPSGNKTDSSATSPVPAGLGRPDETPAAEQPKEEAQEAAAASPAKTTETPAPAEEAPAPPAGASGLDGGGTSLTIDEAGTQKAKKPSEIIGEGTNPTNLAIDEAGTSKSKKVEAQNATDSTATSKTVKEQVKEEVKEEVKEKAKEEAKEKSKDAGKKALDMIKPKDL